MILIEFICKFAEWLWKYILKPLIRFPYWLATARDCKHCKHYKWKIGYGCMNNAYYCTKNNKSVFYTDCYNSITRRDFERKKHKDV